MDPAAATMSYRLFFWAVVGGLTALVAIVAVSIWSAYRLNRQH